MDQQRIIALADRLDSLETAPRNRTLPMGFDMCGYMRRGAGGRPIPDMSGHECDTVACIAGHAVAMYGEPSETVDYCAAGMRILDLTDDQAQSLFVPPPGGGAYSATPRHASTVLRHFARTGEIDWLTPRRDR